MTGDTHKAGGMLCSIVGFSILQHNGLLIPDVNEGVQWLLMYPFCMWGSVASDLDHHWESCPSKSYPDWIINHMLHITKPMQKSLERTGIDKDDLVYKFSKFFNASHRSWQTHSDITIYFMGFLMWLVNVSNFLTLNAVDKSILSIVITGISLGIIAHFILDMLTPEGVWISWLVILNRIGRLINPRLNLPEKIHFVPHAKFFATGGDWEMFIRRVLKVLTVISILWFLISNFSPELMSLIPFEFY